MTNLTNKSQFWQNVSGSSVLSLLLEENNMEPPENYCNSECTLIAMRQNKQTLAGEIFLQIYEYDFNGKTMLILIYAIALMSRRFTSVQHQYAFTWILDTVFKFQEVLPALQVTKRKVNIIGLPT